MERIRQFYYLNIHGGGAPDISVRDFSAEEELGRPWRIEIFFTCADECLDLAGLLNRRAVFSAAPAGTPPRRWSGLLRRVSRESFSNDETLYRALLAPRLDALSDFTSCRLFQNQSVPEAASALLRRHGLSAADFKFNLGRAYERREHLTQYNESDLNFLTRLCEDEGLWWRFEEGDLGDVVVFGDAPAHCLAAEKVWPLRRDAGLEPGLETVREICIEERGATRIQLKDYNYRAASNRLEAEAGQSGDGVQGLRYTWGRHHKNESEGELAARLLHEEELARQCVLSGRGNVLAAAPGLVFKSEGPAEESEAGWLITKIRHQGGRDAAYENAFTAIPAERPFRLARAAFRPRIHSTLPARVVSPGQYPYAFLDEKGRYRVRLPFDLDACLKLNRTPGGDSRPVRLMKPYAGPGYGQHFPLHEGTEVMLAFSGGDPDRPFIHQAMHDSRNPDHVPDSWNSRNVIRTWANNKLRLEDRRGEEHVKLATEFHKSQLNIGHLVDAGRKERGQGFELRSDGWGALRAGQGLFASADARPEAMGRQLDMREAVTELSNAMKMIKGLEKAAVEIGGATASEAEALGELKAAGLVLSAPEGQRRRQADRLEEFVSLYARLTNGHGGGADALFRAELALYRGDMAKAEILARKAAFLRSRSGRHSDRRRQGVGRHRAGEGGHDRLAGRDREHGTRGVGRPPQHLREPDDARYGSPLPNAWASKNVLATVEAVSFDFMRQQLPGEPQHFGGGADVAVGEGQGLNNGPLFRFF